MSADVESQLRSYGSILATETAAAVLARSGGATLVSVPSSATPSRSRWHIVAGGAAAAILVGGLAIVVRSVTTDETTTFAQADRAVAARSTDPAVFLDRLATVDFEIDITPRREPTAEEVERVRRNAAGPNEQPTDAAVRLIAEMPTGEALFEITGNRDKPRSQICHVTDSGGACWGVGASLFPPGETHAWSYGCRPRTALLGLVAYGRVGFNAEVMFAADAPGVIFTLTEGHEVLVRPVNGLVFFAGAMVDSMEVFDPDGTSEVVDTRDCA